MGSALLNRCILATFIILFFVSCNSEKGNLVIGLKENIHHDDFEYSVTSFRKVSDLVKLPDQIKPDSGNYYLIHFRVENRALRVDHKWDNAIGYIIDENGRKYENSKEDQILLDSSLHFGWDERYITSPGNSDSTILVFNLPVSVKNPYLLVRGGILMGDAFNGSRFRKIKVKLF